MAHLALDDLQIYRDAARYCDRVYTLVRTWNSFDSETLGAQLVRASDSVGANIAESYGRYHYAERVHFLYYARGSAYETIYWLKRAGKRGLLSDETATGAVNAYMNLNALINGVIKSTNQRRTHDQRRGPKVNALAESGTEYRLDDKDEAVLPF